VILLRSVNIAIVSMTFGCRNAVKGNYLFQGSTCINEKQIILRNVIPVVRVELIYVESSQ